MTETNTAPPGLLTLADEIRLSRIPAATRKKLRTSAKLSVRRLAHEIRVTHGSVQYYERGGKPGPDIAVRYLQVLDLLAELTGIDISAPTQT